MKRNILTVLMILGLVSSTFANHRGAIFGTFVKYKSSSEVYITSGSGRCNDNEWNHYTESTLDLYSVLPAGEDFIYIYVDDSASSYPSSPAFIGSTTEPAWSDTQCGWYNGNDRCIGVVWCDNAGNIVQFQNNDRMEYATIGADLKQVLSGGNPTGAWTSLEATAYSPVNANAIYIKADNNDSTNSINVWVGTYENTKIAIGGYNNQASVAITGWLPIQRGWSRDLKWYGYDNDDNDFDIYIRGFSIER